MSIIKKTTSEFIKDWEKLDPEGEVTIYRTKTIKKKAKYSIYFFSSIMGILVWIAFGNFSMDIAKYWGQYNNKYVVVPLIVLSIFLSSFITLIVNDYIKGLYKDYKFEPLSKKFYQLFRIVVK